MKLVVHEPETSALLEYLKDRPARVSSRLLAVELLRALHLQRPDALGEARGLIAAIDLVELDAIVAERASGLAPAALRSLDAVHLASALALGDELGAMVTYDARLADAARANGLTVVAPA